jgi:hypothetical protein
MICGLATKNERGSEMDANKRAPERPTHTEQICKICGKKSESTICEGCSGRIRIEVLARKKHEEKGDAWTHWE